MSKPGWSRPNRRNHVLSWSKHYKARYTVPQRWDNLSKLCAILHTLPIAALKDIERRYRPDPRTLPKSTPLGIADHCKIIFGTGTREALGIDSGMLKRLVLANDRGVLGGELWMMIVNELYRQPT